MEQPLFLLVLQFIAFILIICIVYGMLYNTVLKLNMPKWTAHIVAMVFSFGIAYQAFINFIWRTFVAITSIVDAVKLLEKAGLQFERVISRSENVTIFYKVFPAQNSEEVSSAESVFA